MIVPIFLAAYLVGSIPFGYLFVMAKSRLDIREYGSHNVGAINVFRVAGPYLGIATILADAGKALAVVTITAHYYEPMVVAVAAFLVLLGHAYSAYFYLRERRFSEGKCVASGLGVLLGLTFIGAIPAWVVGFVVALWIGILLAPKLITGRWSYISPATMSATASVPIAVWTVHPSQFYFDLSTAMAGLILVRHKNNIRRLLKGEEPKLGDRMNK